MAVTQPTLPDDTALKAVLWDRPDMTRADVLQTLQSPGTPTYFWLLGRFVEYLPPRDMLSLVDRDTLYAMFPKLRIWGRVSVEKARELFPDTYKNVTRMTTSAPDPRRILTPLQWSVLRRFFSSPVSAPFFLTGGTALAGFYFGHRTSVDLDLFTLSPLPRDDLHSLMTTIAKSEGGEFALQTEAPTIVTGFMKTPDVSLKVDLVQDIPIHVGDFKVVDAIRIDALENIGSNKITASYGRLDPKDFVDLYWILEIDRSLRFDDLLAIAKKKDIGITDFHLGHIFVNLPVDLPFPATTPPIDPNTVRQYFKTLGDRLISGSEKPQFG